jgi:hypothetical protein
MADRIMLDGIGSDAAAVTAAIKAGREWGGIKATMGAGYGDGSVSAWSSAEWVALSAVGQPVTVTVLGEPGRNVADVENGDLTVAQGAAWAKAEMAAGRYPVLYVNRSNKAAAIAACSANRLSRFVEYGLWVATLDGTFTDLDGSDLRTQAGVVAVQYLSAGDMDVSLVVDAGWLPVAAPKPPVVATTWQAAALKQAQALVTTLEAHQ